MKNLKDIIIEKLCYQQVDEKLVINKDSQLQKKKIKNPEIGEIAYDYNSELWEIIDYCDINDESAINFIIKNYDNSGCFKDFLDEFDKEDYSEVKYVVAAISEETGEPAVWLWGYDGLCFENKPKK